MAAMTATEYGFPVPEGNAPTLWFDLARAAFDTQAARWNTAVCNGGLRWQIYEENAGYGVALTLNKEQTDTVTDTTTRTASAMAPSSS